MRILPIKPFSSQNLRFKSDSKKDSTKELIHDTIDVTGAVGVFLLLDYLTELKNDTKRVKVGKILLVGSFIAATMYGIVESVKKARNNS